MIARAVAQRLRDRLKQPVVIDNRGGTSGMLGAEVAARSPADGYNLIMAVADTHSINPHPYQNIRYDARKDFTPVGLVGYVSYALIVSPGLKATTVVRGAGEIPTRQDDLRLMECGQFGPSGHGNAQGRREGPPAARAFPRRGAGHCGRAVMSGQVDAMMVPLTLADPNHTAGKVRLLGVAAPKRFAGSTDTPTFAEQGLPLTAGVWLGILGPAHMPPETVARLNRELKLALNEGQLRDTLIKNGLEPMPETPQALRAFLDTEYERWGATLRGAAIRADQGPR